MNSTRKEDYFNSYAYVKSREEWIECFKENHPDLSGEKNGMYGRHHTKEAKLKQSEASRNRPKESWERIRQKKLGMKMSDEFKEKCRQRMLGNTIMKGRKIIWSEEKKESFRKRIKSLWTDEQFRSKRKAAQIENPRCKGKHWNLSDEAKEKHRQSMQGLCWWNNGVINKMSKNCPGKGFVKGMLKRK